MLSVKGILVLNWSQNHSLGLCSQSNDTCIVPFNSVAPGWRGTKSMTSRSWILRHWWVQPSSRKIRGNVVAGLPWIHYTDPGEGDCDGWVAMDTLYWPRWWGLWWLGCHGYTILTQVKGTVMAGLPWTHCTDKGEGDCDGWVAMDTLYWPRWMELWWRVAVETRPLCRMIHRTPRCLPYPRVLLCRPRFRLCSQDFGQSLTLK